MGLAAAQLPTASRVAAATGWVAASLWKTGSVVVTLDANSKVAQTAIQHLMDRYKSRIRFLSPLAFELQMPHQDWPSIFLELTATLQSLGVCDTNSTTTSSSLD